MRKSFYFIYMECKFFLPDGGESSLVDQYFVLASGQNTQSKSLIVPDCTAGIVYVHKGSLSRTGDVFKENDIFLFGQKTKAVEYQFGKDTKAFGCKLSPQALYFLSGIPAHELTDSFVRLDLILSGMEEFKDYLLAGRLHPHLIASHTSSDPLEAILTFIHGNKGLVNIQEISRKFDLGYKKLERLFKKHVGLTPKLYTRIVRFNHSLRISSAQPSLTALAYESGFFDQNHFIKEIKGFTRKAPSELFGEKEKAYRRAHVDYLRARSY